MERLSIKFRMKKEGLEFSGKRVKPEPREPKEMKDVVYDPSGLDSWKKPLYLMYRGINRFAEPDIKHKFKEMNVRYDLTFIFPGYIGPEYNRTHGHFHPRSGRNRYFCEMYEVLSGTGMILLQHRKLEDFEAYYIKKNDFVFIPGEYGHITINSGKKPLLMGNLVIDGFKSMYKGVKRKHGFAYYVFDGDIFVPNRHYSKHPQITVKYGAEIGRIDRRFLLHPNLCRYLLEGRV